MYWTTKKKYIYINIFFFFLFFFISIDDLSCAELSRKLTVLIPCSDIPCQWGQSFYENVNRQEEVCPVCEIGEPRCPTGGIYCCRSNGYDEPCQVVGKSEPSPRQIYYWWYSRPLCEHMNRKKHTWHKCMKYICSNIAPPLNIKVNIRLAGCYRNFRNSKDKYNNFYMSTNARTWQVSWKKSAYPVRDGFEHGA